MNPSLSDEVQPPPCYSSAVVHCRRAVVTSSSEDDVSLPPRRPTAVVHHCRAVDTSSEDENDEECITDVSFSHPTVTPCVIGRHRNIDIDCLKFQT
jgi:hypothetical protein